MNPTLNIAVRAARSAGNVIIRNLGKLDTLAIHTKDRNDFVTEVDRQAEQEIIYILRKAFPGHGILAEESGVQEGNDYQWIIDPLDGTTNFLHGFPQFAVSIAMRHKGRMEHGVIYDPLRQELFTATRGGGAMLNDQRIRVTKRKTLEGSLLGTGFLALVAQRLVAASSQPDLGWELELDGDDLAGSALWFEGALCHLSAFAA